MFDGLQPLIVMAVWWLVALFVCIFLFSIAFGFVIGLITRRPPKPTRSGRITDSAFELGVLLALNVFEKNTAKSTTAWIDEKRAIGVLRGISPAAFEAFCARLFTKLGYKADVVGGASDGGVDIVLEKEGVVSIVQCKKFITKKVTPHDVRDFYGAMGHRQVTGKGYFITTNVFTVEAEMFAQDKNMELIDGNRLVQLVKQADMLVDVVQLSHTEVSGGLCPRCHSELILKEKNGSRFWACPQYPRCKGYTRPA